MDKKQRKNMILWANAYSEESNDVALNAEVNMSYGRWRCHSWGILWDIILGIR